MKRPAKKTPRLDPGLAEVQRWRAELHAEAGGTLEGLVRLIREREAKRKATANMKPTRRRRKSA